MTLRTLVWLAVVATSSACALRVAPEFDDGGTDGADARAAGDVLDVTDAGVRTASAGPCRIEPAQAQMLCGEDLPCPPLTAAAIHCHGQGRAISLAAHAGVGALLYVPADDANRPVMFTLRHDGSVTAESVPGLSDAVAVVDAQGEPHAAGLTLEGTYLSYVSRDGHGGWTGMDFVHPRARVPRAVSAATDSAGNPRVLYVLDDDPARAAITRRDPGGAWTSRDADVPLAFPMRLDIAPDGTSVVAWIDRPDPGSAVVRAFWPLDARTLSPAFAVDPGGLESVGVAGVEAAGGTEVIASIFNAGARVYAAHPDAPGRYREALAPMSGPDRSTRCPREGDTCITGVAGACAVQRAGGLSDAAPLARIDNGQVWIAYATLDARIDLVEHVDCPDGGSTCRCHPSLAQESGNNRLVLAVVVPETPEIQPRALIAIAPRVEPHAVALAAEGSWLHAVTGWLDDGAGDDAELQWLVVDTASLH